MRPTQTGGRGDAAQQRFRDQLLADRAALALVALAEAGPVNLVSDQLLAAASSVQHLSLRNQILMLIQAGDRKLALRDVDTEEGWARRGRVPNQPGLRIVRPHDRPAAASHPAARRRGRRASFRLIKRWEFAQTMLLGGVPDPQTEPEPAGNPAEFACCLLTQLDRRGYRVQPGEAHAVEHDTATVTLTAPVGTGDPTGQVRELIWAMAEVLTSGPDPRDVVLPAAAGGRRAG